MTPSDQTRSSENLFGSGSRRNVLRGLGLSMGLPWLESLMPAASAAAAGGSIGNPGGRPTRMAFLFVPNGVHLPDWTPETEGYGFQLPRTLKPLAPVQNDLLVLSGLTHDKGRGNGDGPGDHARSASVFLTGAQPRKTDGADIRSGTSVDQVAAGMAGHLTRFPSIQLGCEPGRSAGNCDSGYSCAYSSSVSWASDAQPLGKETNPRLVFERLFAGGPSGEVVRSQELRRSLRKSVLDFVAEDATRLQKRLGAADRRKLDEYLTGVREVERRIESADGPDRMNVDLDYPVPAGVPDDYGAHIRLMCDMMVLAFRTDSTRIATFMLADAGSNRSYRHIDIGEGHHELSHHGGDPKKHAKLSDINRFHVQQLSYLIQKMKATPDGDGSLLDSCCVMYGSGLSDGNRHNNENLPIVLAGRANGLIDTGRHMRVPAETPVCNLFMTLLDHFGTSVDFIGDSTGRLQGLGA